VAAASQPAHGANSSVLRISAVRASAASPRVRTTRARTWPAPERHRQRVEQQRADREPEQPEPCRNSQESAHTRPQNHMHGPTVFATMGTVAPSVPAICGCSQRRQRRAHLGERAHAPAPSAGTMPSSSRLRARQPPVRTHTLGRDHTHGSRTSRARRAPPTSSTFRRRPRQRRPAPPRAHALGQVQRVLRVRVVPGRVRLLEHGALRVHVLDARVVLALHHRGSRAEEGVGARIALCSSRHQPLQGTAPICIRTNVDSLLMQSSSGCSTTWSHAADDGIVWRKRFSGVCSC
jgi:hypothetical protein